MADTFAALLRDAGIDPSRTKLLRHDGRGLQAWLQSPDHFLSFASIQSAEHSPFRSDPELVAHFLPGPRLPGGGYMARFVGLAHLHGRWPWDDRRPPRVWVANYKTAGSGPAEAADQSWAPDLAGEAGRLNIDWGAAPRSWHQWANGSAKRILERGAPEDVAAWARGLGTTSFLDEEARYRLTLEQEDRELGREIERNRFALDREFDSLRLALVRDRAAQAGFRESLIARGGPCCAMTGCREPDALEAAHIVPFAEGRPGRNLVSNGLLLRRDVHRLFDLLRISVQADMTIWLHPSLRNGADYGWLHGRVLGTEASAVALAEHFRRAQARP